MNKKELLKALNLSDYVAFDFETTGLDPKHDKIIEVAAIHYVNIPDRFINIIIIIYRVEWVRIFINY